MNEKYELKEKVTHGDETFPLCVYNNDLGYNEHLLDYHWHDEIEFLYLSKGSAVFQVDSTPVQLAANEAVCINRGEIHSGHSLNHSYCVYHSIVFNINMLCNSTQDICWPRYIEPLVNKKCKLPQHITGKYQWEKEVLCNIKNIIDWFFKRMPGYELLIKASLYEMFGKIISNNGIVYTEKDHTALTEYKTERFKKVLNYISSNYQKKLTIKELSTEANLSQYHFCREFKTITGRTPMDYVNYYRINTAARLLEDRDRKIIDIAMDVGFQSFSYFIETFKQYKNCTPSDFRNMLK